jgi:hypothetical protein
MARLRLFGKTLIDSNETSLRIQPYKGGWLVASEGVTVGTVKRVGGKWIYKPNDPRNDGPLHQAVTLLGEYFRENPNDPGAKAVIAAPMLAHIRSENAILKKVGDA